jgi:hypothetical protein
MESKKNDNKVVQIVNNLISNKKIGYIEQGNIVDGMSKMKLNKQNIYNEPYAEVEKVSYELNKLI